MGVDPGAELVRVEDLTVHYGPRRVAHLPGLTVRAGECVALVGESGSGKTSTLMAMIGLLGGTAARVEGHAWIDGTDVLHAPAARVRALRGSTVSLIMQSPHGALNPTMRLGRLLHRALRHHGVPQRRIADRVREALTSVRLPEEVLRRYPHQVSGGQAQRIAIALAMALGSRLIAADEPTSALDVTVQAEIVGVLQRLRRDDGIGIVIVSHDLALVSTIADRIVVMRNGTVVEAGPTAEVTTAPRTAYTRELLAAVPSLEPLS